MSDGALEEARGVWNLLAADWRIQVGDEGDSNRRINSDPVLWEFAGDVRGLSVLDAGCGPNPSFSIALGRWPARRMVGLDISLGLVKLAILRCRRENVPFHGVVGDVEALPFRPDVFDGCVCEDTIEHLPNDEAAVADMARVIRRRGRLLLGTPNRRRLDVVVAKLRHRLKGEKLPPSAYYAATSHLREYTWRSLSRTVRPHFKISRKVTVGWGGSFKAKLASAAVSVWPFRRWGKMLILDLRKR
jgi:ubiquinone/menaquinone biosynthesis C-methylase UbiE